MSKLISMQNSRNVERENNECFCETCERVFGNPIRLTNLSAVPMQIYNACPFCFSKLDVKLVLEPPNDLEMPTSKDSSNVLGKNHKNIDSPERMECPHHLGYLKNRPRDTPIPDVCLTCEKMIKCVLQ